MADKTRKIELLAPAGSMANLKAAVSRGADAVYLGMSQFGARRYASNFSEKTLAEAIRICRSNNVKAYLTMNILVKNDEIAEFFRQLAFAYAQGIDAVIIQETSFLDIIRANFPGLRIHVSTQAGVMNSAHANLLKAADRITLERSLTQQEIESIQKNYAKELEIFVHGALCVSISGGCLFSSLLGGRSGNRGTCAQPCRKKYDGCYYLSTKELCLIDEIPEIIRSGVRAVKIEGRMKPPRYVAAVTDVYRRAIDSCYSGNFRVTPEMRKQIAQSFNRGFTKGWFRSSEDFFQRENPSGTMPAATKEEYAVAVKNVKVDRKMIRPSLPPAGDRASSGKKLIVRVYSPEDGIAAAGSGADIVCLDIFHKDFMKLKKLITVPLYAVTPRMMVDDDRDTILSLIERNEPDGIFAGNYGVLDFGLTVPVILDYCLNAFNDIDVRSAQAKKALPVISPELSLRDIKGFRNKDFAVFVHGKIRLMTLRHAFGKKTITDQIGAQFRLEPVLHGTELLNGKELGFLGKSAQLVKEGINQFYVDTDNNVSVMVKVYRDILDGKNVKVSRFKKHYIIAWGFRGVI